MSNTDLLSGLQMYMLKHHFNKQDGCIETLKTIINSKEKDLNSLNNDCKKKIYNYLTILDTQFDKAVSNSILVASIRNHKN